MVEASLDLDLLAFRELPQKVFTAGHPSSLGLRPRPKGSK
jgi:hypothetical protein